MKITILIPSRNGFDKLKNSINNLVEKSSGEHELEFCIKLDSDDKESLDKISSLDHLEKIKILIYDRMKGYCSIHHFFNNLAINGTGDWYMVYSDDVTTSTINWDKCLENINFNEIIVLHHLRVIPASDKGDYYFPILSKKWIEVLGKVSSHPAIDGFIINVMNDCGIKKQTVPIQFHHNFYDNPIKNFNEECNPKNRLTSIEDEEYYKSRIIDIENIKRFNKNK